MSVDFVSTKLKPFKEIDIKEQPKLPLFTCLEGHELKYVNLTAYLSEMQSNEARKIAKTF